MMFRGGRATRYHQGMDALVDAPIRIRSSAQTDVGRVRQNNEDAFLCEPGLGLYAVADGMGGHAGGEIASEMAIQGLRRAIADIPDAKFLADPSLEHRSELLSFLSRTVASLNAAIYARGQADPNLRGMGCTLDVALIRGRSLFLAHVGDSRVYGLLGGTLYPLTEDHTFGQTLLSGGAMTIEEVNKHPQRNLLMRALGVYPKVEVDTAYLDIAPGDVFLLCSDGVHGVVDPATMEAALRKPSDFAAQTLIHAALDAGGRDNATAVVVHVAACTECQPIRVGGEEVRSAMAAASLFAGFTQSELLRVQRIAMGRIFTPGEYVLKMGQPLTEVYLMIDGQTSIWSNDQKVGWHGPGDPFGAMALQTGESDIAVRIEQPSRLLVFPLDALNQLIQSDAIMGVKLTRNALGRVWQRFQQLADQLSRLRAQAK